MLLTDASYLMDRCYSRMRMVPESESWQLQRPKLTHVAETWKKGSSLIR